MATKDTPWGTWDHIPLPAVVEVLRDFPRPWWVAGGYAIDAFAGNNRREHDDIDVGLFAADQTIIRRHLREWDLHAADPPGTLRPWGLDEELPPHVHDIWVRRHAADLWRFQLMLNPGGPDEFVCRRDERIRMPLRNAVWTKDGVPYLAPELQLFFKAKSSRPKDEQDFEDCLPLFSPARRSVLAEWLRLSLPAHTWLAKL